SGSSYQAESKTGVPTFYSHVVFCGTGKFTEVEFKQKCSDISVKISCRAGVDNLFFSMTAPRIVLKEAIELFGMLMSSPTFEKDKVRKIQNEIGYSMQNYAITPAETAFYTLAPALIFPSHIYKYGLHGNSEHFMKLSIDDLVKYKKKFLVIKNAEACICGNIDENEAVSLLNNVLRGIEKGEPAQDNIPDISPQLTPKITKYYVEGPQSVVIFILKNEKPLSSQKPAISILYRILGEHSSFKSKIMSELRTKQGLIYGGTIIPVDLNHANYAFGVLQTDNSKAQKAIESIKTIINKLRENGITPDELQFAKNNIKGTLLVRLRTSGELCQFYFGKMLDGFKTNALSDYLERTSKVTREEVNHQAKEILDEEKMSFILIGGNE
ncbi:MAG: insulinase family protein, partial [Holosporaceae bacterium]|nr:insulinase family protein [Holosporaceae bacterium]